jgi:hypothetical protein
LNNNDLLPHSQHLKDLSPAASPDIINGPYHQLVCVVVSGAWVVLAAFTHSDSTAAAVCFEHTPGFPSKGIHHLFRRIFLERSGGIFFDNASQPSRSSLVLEVEEHRKSGAEILVFLELSRRAGDAQPGRPLGVSLQERLDKTRLKGDPSGVVRKRASSVQSVTFSNRILNFSTTGSELLKTCTAQRCSPEHFPSGQSTQSV